MTENTKDKRSNLIPKPISQAFYASLAAGGGSLVFGVPLEYAPRIALAGATWSFYCSWLDSRNETKPKKRKQSRQVDFTSYQGRRKIDLEYSVASGGTMIRETYWQALKRKLSGTQRPARVIEQVEKPRILSEFIFRSQGIELLESEVKAFLQIAWRNRDRGRGLSARFWLREISRRPGWFKPLGRTWYTAFLMLLVNAEKVTGRSLVIELGYQQHGLRYDARQTYVILKWAESEVNNGRKNR